MTSFLLLFLLTCWCPPPRPPCQWWQCRTSPSARGGRPPSYRSCRPRRSPLEHERAARPGGGGYCSVQFWNSMKTSDGLSSHSINHHRHQIQSYLWQVQSYRGQIKSNLGQIQLYLTNPVKFRTNPVKIRTYPVIFFLLTNPVKFLTNTVTFRTNLDKFRKNPVI